MLQKSALNFITDIFAKSRYRKVTIIKSALSCATPQNATHNPAAKAEHRKPGVDPSLASRYLRCEDRVAQPHHAQPLIPWLCNSCSWRECDITKDMIARTIQTLQRGFFLCGDKTDSSQKIQDLYVPSLQASTRPF